MRIDRIALVGASSTGKTTVYELLKNKLPKNTIEISALYKKYLADPEKNFVELEHYIANKETKKVSLQK